MRLEDARGLALKVGEGAINLGMQKKQINKFSLGASGRNAATPQLDFRISDLHNYMRINLCLW